MDPSGRSRRARAAALCLLGLLALTACLLRLPSHGEPLERDLATYAVIGRELLSGRLLYADLFDHKPPAIHATYAAALALAPDPADAALLLGSLAAALTVAALYACGRAAGLSRWPALLAPALFAAVSADLGLQANQPNVEAFVNACIAWGAVLALMALRVESARAQVLLAAGAGLLAGLAVVYKTNALGFLPVFALAWAIACALAPSPRASRAAAARFAVCVALGLAPLVLVFLYFLASGRLRPFLDAVLVYNREYAGGVARNLVRMLLPKHLFHHSLAGVRTLGLFFPMALAYLLARGFSGRAKEAISAGSGRWSLERSQAVLLGGMTLATLAAIAAPGRFYPHYYQLWLPLFALVPGLALGSLGRARPIAAAAIASGLLVASALHQLPALVHLTPDDWSRKKYGETYLEVRAAARAASSSLPAGATLYAWGEDPGVYIEAGVHPPAGVLYNSALLRGPLAGALSERVVADLERARPAAILIDRGSPWPPEHPVVRWIEAGYDEVAPPPAEMPARFALRVPRR